MLLEHLRQRAAVLYSGANPWQLSGFLSAIFLYMPTLNAASSADVSTAARGLKYQLARWSCFQRLARCFQHRIFGSFFLTP